MKNKKRYECKCDCGETFDVSMSIAQHMGMLDAGHASCPSCKVFFNLTLDEENSRMILTPWDDFMKKRSEDNENQTKMG